MSSGSIQFGMTTIPYEVVYSERRKRAAIAVYPNKRVVITVPKNLTPDETYGLMQKKAPWVIRKIDWFNQLEHPTLEKEYVNGETFLYLGRQYRLKIRHYDSGPTAKLKGKFFEVAIPVNTSDLERSSLVKKALLQWYNEHAERRIGEIVFNYAKRLYVEAPSFKVKYQAKRWGSCSRGNKLNINIRIIMAPVSQVEYVIAHELCHLKYNDHSTEYWQLLRLIMPDYEIRKEKLKSNGWMYNI